MKRGILFLLGFFMMVSSVEANVGNNFPDRFGFVYSYDNSVNFVERGIEFFVFTNGDFDFNTRFGNNRGVRINRNFNGQIRRVGNVFINYDRFGNVTRIGNIFINYRRGRLHRVGDLRVSYDRWGYPFFTGNVRNFYYDNGVRFHINFGDVFGYNDRFFFRNNFRRNYIQFREDRNFYYYKARPNANIGKRSQIIRRRKPANVRNNRTIRRDNNITYRKKNSSINRNDRRNNDRTFNNDRRRNDNTKRIEKSRSDDRRFNKNSERKRLEKSYRDNDKRKTKKEKSTVRNRRS